MNIMEVNDITVDYGGGKGVFDLSFTVKKGEILGFLGPNGAGKTTTIRQLMGFAHPMKGNCRILGMDCKAQAHLIQQHIGYLPGEIAFMDDMTGPQFIKFIAEMKELKSLERAYELMDYYELNPEGRIKKMSKGMKQKLGIVCALMQEPDILILDEPTSGLDPLMQNKFIEMIQAEKLKGTTVLMSSHIFEEVERTCDRAAIIKSGRLMTVEDVKTLIERKRKGFVVTFATERMASSFSEEVTGIDSIRKNRVSLSIEGNIMPFIVSLAKYEVLNLQASSQSLEELFLHYYGGGGND